MHLVTEGMVLREAPYKESDKILTVLTRDEGKKTVRARGARRMNNKLAAAARPLVYSRMTLFEHNGRCTLDEAETLDGFAVIGRDVGRMALALYLAELTEALTDEAPDEVVFTLLLGSLRAMSHHGKSPNLVKPAAEMRLMSQCGFQPSVGGCPVCGKQPPMDPCLHLALGLAHCAACREQLEEGASMPLGDGGWLALRHITRCEPQRLFSFSLTTPPLASLSAASEAFVLTHLDRGFRTLDFYRRTMEFPSVSKD